TGQWTTSVVRFSPKSSATAATNPNLTQPPPPPRRRSSPILLLPFKNGYPTFSNHPPIPPFPSPILLLPLLANLDSTPIFHPLASQILPQMPFFLRLKL
ncbi:hypothetical protein Csa_023786, partial [Cucumis sativus]